MSVVDGVPSQHDVALQSWTSGLPTSQTRHGARGPSSDAIACTECKKQLQTRIINIFYVMKRFECSETDFRRR